MKSPMLLSHKKLNQLTLKNRDILFIYGDTPQNRDLELKLRHGLQEKFGCEDMDADSHKITQLLIGDSERLKQLMVNQQPVYLLFQTYNAKNALIQQFIKEEVNINRFCKQEMSSISKKFKEYLDGFSNQESVNKQWKLMLDLVKLDFSKEEVDLSFDGQWFLIQEKLMKMAFLGVENMSFKTQKLLSYSFNLEDSGVPKQPSPSEDQRKRNEILDELITIPELEKIFELDLKIFRFSCELINKLYLELQMEVDKAQKVSQRDRSLYPLSEIVERITNHQESLREKAVGIRKPLFRLFPPGSTHGDVAQKWYMVIKRLVLKGDQNRIVNSIQKEVHRPNSETKSISLVINCQRNFAEDKQYWLSKFNQSNHSIMACWFVTPEDGTIRIEKYLHGLDHSSDLVPINGSLKYLLETISSDYIGFFRDDNRISEDFFPAIHESFNLIGTKPVDLFYFDGKYQSGTSDGQLEWYKPSSFSPAMLLSSNYIYPAIMSRNAIEGIVGLKDLTLPLDRSSEWELSLSISRVKNIHIQLFPKTIWLENDGSTLSEQIKKDFLKKHLQELGLTGTTVEISENDNIHYQWDYHPGKVSIIIPTKDKLFYVYRLLNSIINNTSYKNLEIILVDNGSQVRKSFQRNSFLSKKYDHYLETHNNLIRVLDYDESFNYSKANNLGASAAGGMYLLFLNNDMLPLNKNWLSELVMWASVPSTGVVTGKLLYPDRTIQAFGTVMGMNGHAGHLFQGMNSESNSLFGSTTWYRNASAVTGACMMMRHDVFKKIGGFNEGYKLAFSDVEFCLQAMALGYENVCNPFSEIIHYEGRSRSKHVPYNDLLYGLQRMGNDIENGDEFYSASLSLQSTVPILRRETEIDPIENIIQRMGAIKFREESVRRLR